MLRIYLILLMTLLFVGQGSAQSASSLRNRTLLLHGDTIVLDTFSIVKGSFRFLQATSDTTNYILLEDEGILIRKKGATNQHQDSVKILFRVFPFNFTEPVRNKERRRATAQERGIYNPFVYTPSKSNENLLKFDGLNKSGSISRGISVGNNQDLSVN